MSNVIHLTPSPENYTVSAQSRTIFSNCRVKFRDQKARTQTSKKTIGGTASNYRRLFNLR